jgi:serine/threonine protein kinase
MIGEQFGNWKIVKKINRGGMADVYLAEEINSAEETPSRAAIKILRLDEEDAPGVSERFSREIDVLRTLKHDNIVRLYESGEYLGRPYLVMEYVDGLSLDQVLEQRGKLHWEEVINIGQMVASALRYAHRQEVIHRDLKPANLLASWDRVVKLTDFGIARLLHDTRLTKDRTVIGTASYLSPEQAAGKAATRKSDLYALGVVLYELVTGRLPFEAATDAEMLHKQRYGQFEVPSRLVEEIPADFDQLIIALLEKDPDKRPPNALAVEDALLKLRRKFDRKRQYTPTPVAAPTKVMARGEEEEEEQPVRRGSGRSSFPWGQGLLLVAALAGLFWLYSWLRQPPSGEALHSRIQQALQGGDWDEAQKQLEELKKLQGDEWGADRLQSLQEQIQGSKTYQQAKAQLGPLLAAPSKSEAERFYRRGVMLSLEGNPEQARATWQALIEAFKETPAEGPWVRLAQESLKQQETAVAVSFEDALKTIMATAPAERNQRLEQLKKLYAALPESAWKKEALEKIARAAGK